MPGRTLARGATMRVGHGSGRRWAARTAVAGLLAALVAVPWTTVRQARPAAAAEATPRTEDQALARAAQTGERVEIPELRGESREVYAEPSGDLSAVQHLQPVRTRRNGAWASIDSTLQRRQDGSVAPAAVSVD